MSLKVLFEAKPTKTFSMQVSFNIGWRHEPKNKKGVLRKALEELMKAVLSTLPPWFDALYHLDSEYSSLTVLGTVQDQENLLKILNTMEMNFPPVLEELGASPVLVALSGGVRKNTVSQIREYSFEIKPGKPKIVAEPKRFLALKELSRSQKHFLTFLCMERGCEIFLEISPNGDRLHYGMNLKELKINSLEKELKRYEAWLLRRYETTKSTTHLLTIFNIYSKKELSIQDALNEVMNLSQASLEEFLKLLSNISNRLKH